MSGPGAAASGRCADQLHLCTTPPSAPTPPPTPPPAMLSSTLNPTSQHPPGRASCPHGGPRHSGGHPGAAGCESSSRQGGTTTGQHLAGCRVSCAAMLASGMPNHTPAELHPLLPTWTSACEYAARASASRAFWPPAPPAARSLFTFVCHQWKRVAGLPQPHNLTCRRATHECHPQEQPPSLPHLTG